MANYIKIESIMTGKEIDKLLEQVEQARQKFTRGEMSAEQYWKIRERNYKAIIEGKSQK